MRPFWTEGPVPFGLLEPLSLPRSRAEKRLHQTLAMEHYAEIGGPPGSGRSTLANRIAAARADNALFIEGDSLLTNDEEDFLAQIADSTGVADPDPVRIRRRLHAHGIGLLVLDGLSPDAKWAPRLPGLLDTNVLIIHDGDGIRPDSIQDLEAGTFLRQGARRVGAEWTALALDSVVRFADGQVDALQWLGQCALNAHLLSRRDRIDEDAVLEGAVIASRHLPHRHAERLARVRGARRSLLKAVARFPHATPTEWAHHCRLPVPSTMVHLGRLVREDNVLIRESRGSYRFASALVGLHMQERYGSVTRSYVNPAPGGSSGTRPSA